MSSIMTVFIPRGHNDALGPRDFFTANMERLKVPDALFVYAIPDVPEHIFEKWGAMDNVDYKISTFTTTMKDEHLKDNSLTRIGKYYDSIKIFLQVANKQNVGILPELTELPPSNSLHNETLSQPSLGHFFLGWATRYRK